MTSPPHGITGPKHHRPDKTNNYNFHTPGKGMADYISKKNLHDESHKHNDKRQNRYIFLDYISNKK
jgi:hypothetical protein